MLTQEEAREAYRQCDEMEDTLRVFTETQPLSVVMLVVEKVRRRMDKYLEEKGLEGAVCYGKDWSEQRVRSAAYELRNEAVEVLRAEIRGTSEDHRLIRKCAWEVLRWFTVALQHGEGSYGFGAPFEVRVECRRTALKHTLKMIGKG